MGVDFNARCNILVEEEDGASICDEISAQRNHNRALLSSVAEALEELEPDYRAIIVLRDVEDMAYEDIASALDVAKGTVKSRLHRARSQLARILSRNLKPEDIL